MSCAIKQDAAACKHPIERFAVCRLPAEAPLSPAAETSSLATEEVRNRGSEFSVLVIKGGGGVLTSQHIKDASFWRCYITLAVCACKLQICGATLYL